MLAIDLALSVGSFRNVLNCVAEITSVKEIITFWSLVAKLIL